MNKTIANLRIVPLFAVLFVITMGCGRQNKSDDFQTKGLTGLEEDFDLTLNYKALFGKSASTQEEAEVPENDSESLDSLYEFLLADETIHSGENTEEFEDITFSVFFTYDTQFQNQRYYRNWMSTSNQQLDPGTHAAYTFIEWLEKQNAKDPRNKGKGLFTEGFSNTEYTFPQNPHQVDTNEFYTYKTTAPKLIVKFTKDGQEMEAKINLKMQIHLGPVVKSSNRTMDPRFKEALAQSLVNDHVVSYNGHIWTSQYQYVYPTGEAVPIGDNTKALAKQIREIGGRKQYGVVTFNMCEGEDVEAELLNALKSNTASTLEDSVMISQRNYSNFGYFAEQTAKLWTSLLKAHPMWNVLLGFVPETIIEKTNSNLSGWMPIIELDNEEESKNRLEAYLNEAKYYQGSQTFQYMVIPVVNQ